ncbi:hypothetical protein FRX31_018434, partial [Thalictrum thalictroides]
MQGNMPKIVYEATQSSVNQQEDSEDDFVNVDTTKRRVSPRLRQVKLMEMIQMKRKRDEKGKSIEQVEVTELHESPSKKAKKMMIALSEENQENDRITYVGSSRQRKPSRKPKTPKNKKKDKAIASKNPYGSFRCCTKVMVAITQDMNMTLLESHKQAMLKTPFGPFFNLFLEKKIRKEIISSQNRNFLFEIIKRYSVEEDAFKFGEGKNVKFVKFKPKHVALTFGLPLHGTKVAELFRRCRFDPDQSSFLVKHDLQHPGDIQKKVMTSKIKSLMTEEGSENDFCRMVVLLMSATIFFPNSNYSIGKSFVVHLENLETMKKLGWTDVIYSELMKKLKTKKDNPLSVTACVITLLVWFCEIYGVMEPRKGYTAGTPRIGKWNFTKLSEAWHNDFFQNITKDK